MTNVCNLLALNKNFVHGYLDPTTVLIEQIRHEEEEKNDLNIKVDISENHMLIKMLKQIPFDEQSNEASNSFEEFRRNKKISIQSDI